MPKIRTAISLTVFGVSTTAALIGAAKGFVELKNDLGQVINDMYEDQFKAEEPRHRPVVSTLYNTKEFIGRHKVAIAVASTATVTLWMHKNVVDEFTEFLENKGLLNEYWLWPGDEGLVVLA